MLLEMKIFNKIFHLLINILKYPQIFFLAILNIST